MRTVLLRGVHSLITRLHSGALMTMTYVLSFSSVELSSHAYIKADNSDHWPYYGKQNLNK